jgi:hypothetical protein
MYKKYLKQWIAALKRWHQYLLSPLTPFYLRGALVKGEPVDRPVRHYEECMATFSLFLSIAVRTIVRHGGWQGFLWLACGYMIVFVIFMLMMLFYKSFHMSYHRIIMICFYVTISYIILFGY